MSTFAGSDPEQSKERTDKVTSLQNPTAQNSHLGGQKPHHSSCTCKCISCKLISASGVKL